MPKFEDDETARQVEEWRKMKRVVIELKIPSEGTKIRYNVGTVSDLDALVVARHLTLLLPLLLTDAIALLTDVEVLVEGVQ